MYDMKRKRIISIILLIIWMILIFVMSSFPGNDSSNQSNFIVNIIANIFNINNLSTLSFIIRKLAHVTEFLILGLLFTNVVHLYNKHNYWGIVYSFLYAICDEIHQYFIPDRACQITDMFIDLFGIILGFLLYKLITKVVKRN